MIIVRFFYFILRTAILLALAGVAIGAVALAAYLVANILVSLAQMFLRGFPLATEAFPISIWTYNLLSLFIPWEWLPLAQMLILVPFVAVIGAFGLFVGLLVVGYIFDHDSPILTGIIVGAPLVLTAAFVGVHIFLGGIFFGLVALFGVAFFVMKGEFGPMIFFLVHLAVPVFATLSPFLLFFGKNLDDVVSDLVM